MRVSNNFEVIKKYFLFQKLLVIEQIHISKHDFLSLSHVIMFMYIIFKRQP